MTGIFKVNLQLEEISTVPSAVSGAIILYADASSHRLYIRNSSGALLIGSMDNPMTTAGDLIVGGADGVPTRMALGTADYALTVNSAGTGIGYTDGSAIPQVAQNTSDISDLSTGKQDKLTAGTGIDITSNVISATTATSSALGISKPDNSTITISDGVLTASTATTSSLGVVQPDGTTITINNGVISGLPSFENPMTTAGDIIVGGASGAATRMGLGTSNYVLGVNSAGTGLEYSDGSNIPAISSKQDTLTAGTGISISSNTISATTATPNDLGICKPDNVTMSINDGVLTCLVSGGMTNPMTTLGDVIVGGNSGAPARLAMGTANYVLGVNNAGNGLQYSDGSSIPAVAQNTTDIEALKYQVNIPSDLYLTSTETSTGSGVYTLSLTEPTSSSPTTLTATVSDTEAKLYEFDYTFPAAGTIYKDNQYSIALPLSDLTTTESYVLRYVLKHVDANSTATNIVNFTANAIEPTSTTYTVQEDLPDILASDLAHAAGDKLILEVYGTINSGTADCNLVVEDTSLLATLHRQIPTSDISATHVLTTIGGSTITQQSFNETVNTSLSGKMTNPMNTQGDLIIGGSSGAPARLGIGSAGQILRVNSGETAVEYVDMPVGSTAVQGVVSVDGTTIQSVAGTISVASGALSTTTFRYWN